MNPQYSYVADIYSHLMKLINYKDWAEYISALYEAFDMKGDKLLELAGGQCSVSKYLVNKYPKIISTDLSLQMLKKCDNSKINKVCCNMLAPPFKQQFDYIFSTFDSVNYLITEDHLRVMFLSVSEIMHKNSYFTFDVSLERNSIKYQKHLNRKGVFNGIKYIQKSNYNREERIHYNDFQLVFENGQVYEEQHKQKIYEFEDYFRILEDTDLRVVACFDSFTFDNANHKTERAQFILKKRV